MDLSTLSNININRSYRYEIFHNYEVSITTLIEKWYKSDKKINIFEISIKEKKINLMA